MNPRVQEEQAYHLSHAAYDGDLKTVKQLLKNGVPVDCLNDGYTPLWAASQNGHLEVIKELLAFGADPNFEYLGQSTLWTAVYNKHANLIPLLIQHGACVDVINNNFTPLYVAITNNDLTSVNELIKANGDVNLHNQSIDRSPLCEAVILQERKIVKALIKAGVTIDSINISNEKITPLCLAITKRDIPIITALLHAGANVNFKSPHGKTSLFFAHQNFPEFAKQLVDLGASPIDINQNRIIEQCIIYYKKMHEKYPDRYDIKYIAAWRRGLCAGLSRLWSIMKDDCSDYFDKILQSVENWDGNVDNISSVLQDFFEKKLAAIIWLAENASLSDIVSYGYKFQKNVDIINFILSDDECLYEEVMSLGFVFKQEELKNLLKEITQKNITVFISSLEHRISIKKISGEQYVYDSNSSVGELIATSIDDLVLKIALMFGYNANDPHLGLTIEVISKKANNKKDQFQQIKTHIVNNLIADRKRRNEVNLQDSKNQLTALTYAARVQDEEVIAKLLRSGADVNIQGKYTPLLIATQTGNIPIVKTLMANGASVDTICSLPHGGLANALSIATYCGYTELVVELLAMGNASVHLKMDDQKTALHIAATMGHLDIVKTLIQYNAEINAKAEPLGESPLVFAIKNGHSEIVRYLLKNKADYQTPADEKGMKLTPMGAAILYNKLNIVKMLVKQGVNLNAPACLNYLPIQIARTAMEKKGVNSDIMDYLTDQMIGNLLQSTIKSISKGYKKNNFYQEKSINSEKSCKSKDIQHLKKLKTTS